MIKIINENSEYNKIPARNIIELLKNDELINFIKSICNLEENSGDYLQASINLSFAINLCCGSSAISNPVLNTLILSNNERISPRNNLIVEINKEYYNIISKNYSFIADSILDSFDDYLIPDQKFKLVPDDRSYLIRDEIIRMHNILLGIE